MDPGAQAARCHGEALGDHGELTHGLFAYEATLKVPLIVIAPGATARKEAAYVRHIDIAPTILARAGVTLPATLPGQSLLGEIGMWRQDGRIYLVLDDALYEQPQLPTEILAVAESSEELEREAKVFPKGSLVHTLETYNAGAARGEDPLFRKEARWLAPLASPPYVVLDLTVEDPPIEDVIDQVFTAGTAG